MYILDFFDIELTFDDNSTLKELKSAYIKEFNDIVSHPTQCVTCDIQTLRDKYLDILFKLDLN